MILCVHIYTKISFEFHDKDYLKKTKTFLFMSKKTVKAFPAFTPLGAGEQERGGGDGGGAPFDWGSLVSELTL